MLQMFDQLGPYILTPSAQLAPTDRLRFIGSVGAKACGLALLPPLWTPPFFVVGSNFHEACKACDGQERHALIASMASEISTQCESRWSPAWSNGIILRSSSVTETLNERGAYVSLLMPADFGQGAIQSALQQVYESFAAANLDGILAVIVQARVNTSTLGHASNERRVSKTINQWMWETGSQKRPQGRFNSQRANAADRHQRLPLGDPKTGFVHSLRRIGRWCTELNLGPTHLEWGLSAGNLWLFQIDFEDDQPDLGEDPRALLRQSDPRPPGAIPEGSPLRLVGGSMTTGWPKIDKIGSLTIGRTDPFPRLHYLTGAQFQDSEGDGYDLRRDIEGITHGRAICRTDCVASGIDRLNLPRTECVSAKEAVDFMRSTLASLVGRGANPDEVCFIIHKFIPSAVAVWALARPDQAVVLVDSLWGLPDGLQYLSHDTFEYDVIRSQILSETIRFKNRFLQETTTGQWHLTRISRAHCRSRSISSPDLREVSIHTHGIASSLGKPVRIMWFCDVAVEAGVGRNVPWFMMPPEDDGPPSARRSVAPDLRKVVARTMVDLDHAMDGFDEIILQLEPVAELFRDDTFIDRVIEVARTRGCPVSMTGSILSHAFYKLERANISVITNAPVRSRTRQRKVFRKLVRDGIPMKIAEKDERVVLAHIRKVDTRAALVVKLFEEAQELLAATTLPEVTEELADLLEVLRALCTTTGIDWAKVLSVADKKKDARGGFEQNVVLLETSSPIWNSAASKLGSGTISLKDLGVVHSDGLNHHASFPAIISQDGANIVELSDGRLLSVSLDGAGIKLSEVKASAGRRGTQMSFRFGDKAGREP